jgi:actin-like ATPase involved in cell morphogenesis
MTHTLHNLKQALSDLKNSSDQETLRQALSEITKEIPRKLESLELFQLGFEIIERITDDSERMRALIDFAKELPVEAPFLDLYTKAVEAATLALDDLDDQQYRITELVRIASEIPETGQYEGLRVHVWRLALGLPERPHFKKPDLAQIAKRLPKTVDYTFYRRYTLLGIAAQMPRDGVFFDIYKEAIQLAMEAAGVIPEPYYKKYALVFIARESQEIEGFASMYKQSIESAYKAAGDIKEQFARQHAYIGLLNEIPKTESFVGLLDDLLVKALDFFNVRSWMGDIDVYDMVDYVLSVEEQGMNESRQKRLLREKYSVNLSDVIERFGTRLKDTRFIDTLKPYTHVWIQPKGLRDSVKKVVEHLESLKEKYHGSEIERPVFIKDLNPLGPERLEGMSMAIAPEECISVDLGATNTVVMRKKGKSRPEFVVMEQISKTYDGTCIVPTILSAEVNAIGTEVADETPLVNIKQMLLDGNPRGAEYMERFLKILYQHLKKTVVTAGWFTLFSKGLADILYITVPVGFVDYRKALEGIARKVFRGIKTELIEEPLAAAVGYQVATEKDKVIMVIDFGGCTLDTMILRLNINEVHVVAKPDMAQMLGGYDIDVWLAEHLAAKIALSPKDLPYALLTRAEEIKIALSKANEVPFEWDGRFIADISREELEEVLDKHEFYKLVDRSIMYVLRRAEKVGLKKDKIEAVLLTGGSSQIPSFKEKIGHIFTELRRSNEIYDHSPLSAVSMGAALYGTREIVDRHLGMAYAIRYATVDKDELFSHSIIFEKGGNLPLEKTFRVTPAKKLGSQKDISVELFEVPESLVARRWLREDGVEYLRQELAETKGVVLNALKTITLPYDEPLTEDQFISFKIDESGNLSIKYGPKEMDMETGVRLQ